MSDKAVLEVCAFHLESCLIAERCGAIRVELCDNPVEGGTTPGYGTIKIAREKISILLYPILRPRSGNSNSFAPKKVKCGRSDGTV